jgi:hypothetical protein
LLVNNKIGKLDASNKQVYTELAAMRDQLKVVQEAQKTMEDALAANEKAMVERVQVATKLLNDNLNAIAASIKSLTVAVFRK